MQARLELPHIYLEGLYWSDISHINSRNANDLITRPIRHREVPSRPQELRLRAYLSGKQGVQATIEYPAGKIGHSDQSGSIVVTRKWEIGEREG